MKKLLRATITAKNCAVHLSKEEQNTAEDLNIECIIQFLLQ